MFSSVFWIRNFQAGIRSTATTGRDVFGGVRRSLEVATANLQASQEDLRDALVSLLSEVALNYLVGYPPGSTKTKERSSRQIPLFPRSTAT
jgi:hypothetical protein